MIAWVDISALPQAVDRNGEHWACVIRSDSNPIWVRLPGSGEGGAWTEMDDRLADELHRVFRAYAPGQTATWRQQLVNHLRTQRIDSVNPYLENITRLVVLPAGRMSGVPVETLTDDYVVSYAPSGSVYAWLQEEGDEKGKDRGSLASPELLLALGDPVYLEGGEVESTPPSPPDHGVMIASVVPESNAWRSGLEENDVLLSYGGERLDGPQSLGPALEKAANASSEDMQNNIPVSVWRNGESIELEVMAGRLGISPSPQPAAEAVEAKRRLDDILDHTRGLSLTPLPHTRHEVTAIAGLFDTGAAAPVATVLLGSQASEQQLYELASADKLKDFRYIHLAAHGKMNDETSMHSAIILSQDRLPDASGQWPEEELVFDGRLTADQIVDTWKLNADLVTLSGCETALGRKSGGEGYLGFSQALFVAGADSLVLSLWRVDDKATMLMMTRFYENLLGRFEETRQYQSREYEPGTPLPKAEALGEAKRWLRDLSMDQATETIHKLSGKDATIDMKHRNGRSDESKIHPFQDPAYWAAFVLVGSPD